jgi:hypothetical protein
MALIKLTQATNGESVFAKATEGGTTITIDQRVVWTARGYGFQAMATSAVASLVARPTTTAMATIRNNSNSKVLVIDEAFGHNLVAVAESAFSLWLCSHPVGMAAITNDITVRNSLNGSAAGGSETSFDNGATVTDDGWFPWGVSDHTVTVTTPGGVVIAPVNGRIIVPPTGGISLQCVGSTTGVTITAGFRWYEIPVSELALS